MSENDLSSITAPQEDARRRAGGSRRRGSGNTGRSGSSALVNGLLAVLFAGLGVAGWFIVNQHRLLLAEQAKAADANQRLQSLEQRLRMTDQVVSETDAETDEQIKLWESEIRKLWAIANERNKAWIQDNQKQLETLASSIASLEGTNKSMRSAVDRHEQALSQQQTLADQLASIELQLQQILRSQRDMVDRVNASTQMVAGLGKRTAENEEAVASFDKFRVQVNNRLADLGNRLADLNSRLAQMDSRMNSSPEPPEPDPPQEISGNAG